MPPLRDRRDDIPELIPFLLSRHAERMGRSPVLVDNMTIRRLSAASWKGNVRELDNALERAMILAEGSLLSWADFPPELVRPAAGDDRDLGADSDDLRSALDRFERAHILRVLDRCGGDKREAARRLGLGLSSLYRKLDESGTGSPRA
jgi:DNA-binding NtrC family response regulator